MNFTLKNGDKQIIQEYELQVLNSTSKKKISVSQDIKIGSKIQPEPNKLYTDLMPKSDIKDLFQQDKNKKTESGKKETDLKGQSLLDNIKKPKQPTMKVKCNFCGKLQVVSAKRGEFRCESCGQKSKCNAIYGVLTCMSCTKKVLFMKGVAGMIRCTNCSTINIAIHNQKIQENQQSDQ